MTFRLAKVLATVSALAISLGGCTTSAVSLPDGVHVAVFQNRLDYASRQLELKVVNDSSTPFTVTSARFESTRFATPAEWNRAQAVPAAGARDLRVQLGDPVCEPGLPSDIVTLDFILADGRQGSATVIPIDETGRLDIIAAQDCLEVAVTEHALIEGPNRLDWMPGAQSPAVLELAVTPRPAAGSLTVLSAQGTNLFGLVDVQGALIDNLPLNLVVDSQSEPSVISLRVVPNRCDVHAIAEDKRGTFFGISVATNRNVQGQVFIAMSDDVRASLYEFYADYCNFP